MPVGVQPEEERGSATRVGYDDPFGENYRVGGKAK